MSPSIPPPTPRQPAGDTENAIAHQIGNPGQALAHLPVDSVRDRLLRGGEDALQA